MPHAQATDDLDKILGTGDLGCMLSLECQPPPAEEAFEGLRPLALSDMQAVIMAWSVTRKSVAFQDHTDALRTMHPFLKNAYAKP